MSPDDLPQNENNLRDKLANDPTSWETRRLLARLLHDKDQFSEAGEVIWQAENIPSNDIDIAFAARVLAKAHPRRAIRLLTAVLELNRGKSVQNMGMANALIHHGLVLQAARFYGAALEADPSLVNPDLEHFIFWTDDEMTLWSDFKNRRPKLGELPWMARDPLEALRLTSRISLHTTPISIPKLASVPGEMIQNELYQQESAKNAKITPPPAVTIPIDRVKEKDRRFDEHYGATVTAQVTPAPAKSKPRIPAPPGPLSASEIPAPPPTIPLTYVTSRPTTQLSGTPPIIPSGSPTRRLLAPSAKPTVRKPNSR